MSMQPPNEHPKRNGIGFKLRKFTYWWLHIPTGESGERTVQLTSELELLRILNTWNSASHGKWQYWWDGK